MSSRVLLSLFLFQDEDSLRSHPPSFLVGHLNWKTNILSVSHLGDSLVPFGTSTDPPRLVQKRELPPGEHLRRRGAERLSRGRLGRVWREGLTMNVYRFGVSGGAARICL